MNPFLVTAVFAATLAFGSAADELQSSVRFSNNDRLSGSMESLTTERLIWKSPILEKPTPFFLKNVLDLTLSAEQPDDKSRHEATVTLTRGDLLRGQLVSANDDAVELDTWYAGRLKIHRPMVTDIRITERPDSIYRGPRGLDGWKQSDSKPAWTYQNSSFRSVAAGGIARNVNLPDECSIAFDAAWKGSFWLKLVFFSDEIGGERPIATGYEMTFQQRSVQLRSRKGQRFIGQTPNATALQENEKARIEVRASAKSGTICLFVDGHILEKWIDPELARNEIGQGIHFIANDSSIQISHIEVGAWDGEVDQLPDPQAPGGMALPGMPGALDSDEDAEPAAPVEKPPSGRMELRNGDSIAGEVLAIKDGIITVKTPFRDVKLPIESLRSVALKPVDRDESKRENGDVRGWFPDGSSVVFRLDGVGDGTLTGYSQNFGTANFKIDAFSRIEFNIYDPDLEDVRMANGW